MRRAKRRGRYGEIKRSPARVRAAANRMKFTKKLNIEVRIHREHDSGGYHASACVRGAFQRKRTVVLGVGLHKRCMFSDTRSTPTAAAQEALRMLALNLRNQRHNLIRTR